MPPEIATEPVSGNSWAVLGGGFLGMTLALRLAQQGKDVTLIESTPYLGGLASAWRLGDVTWDRHYHVTLLSDSHLRGLLRELRLEDEITWVQTKTGFFTDSCLHSMSNSLDFLRFPPLTLVDKFRLAMNIIYASRLKDWKSLENISATDWLLKWSGAHTFQKIWLPLLRSKLGENSEKASAAFIWAIIARMYAARHAGMKREMFGYVQGGYARVLENMERRLVEEGVKLELGKPVRQVEKTDGGLTVHFGGERRTFSNVVPTMAAPLAAKVCPGLSNAEVERLSEVEYQGIICASLLLKKPLADYYVTNITDPWVPYTAVIEMTALVDRKQFGGKALVYLPKYVPAASPDFAIPDGTIRNEYVQGLARMYPHFRPEDVLCFQVSRVKYVLPIPTLRYSERRPSMQTSTPGLYIVNSCHIENGTLNVNETVQLAERAARWLSNLPSTKLPDQVVTHVEAAA